MPAIIEIELLHTPVSDVEVLLQYVGGDVAVELVDDAVDAIEISFAEAGPQGLPGPTGASGGNYVHDQGVPAAIWTINHPLGYPPAGILVIDSSGAQCYGSIEILTALQVRINFGSAFSGICYLS